MRADGESSLFLGAQSAYTTDPSFYYPKEHTLPALMPCFRLMDDEGVAVPGATLPELDKETCVKMITTMVSVNEFDKVYNDAQRQGRLSFYFTNRGEEAVAVGTAPAGRAAGHTAATAAAAPRAACVSTARMPTVVHARSSSRSSRRTIRASASRTAASSPAGCARTATSSSGTRSTIRLASAAATGCTLG